MSALTKKQGRSISNSTGNRITRRVIMVFTMMTKCAISRYRMLALALLLAYLEGCSSINANSQLAIRTQSADTPPPFPLTIKRETLVPFSEHINLENDFALVIQGKKTQYQKIDVNQDGTWDELAVIVDNSIKHSVEESVPDSTNETLLINVEQVSTTPSDFSSISATPKTNIRLARIEGKKPNVQSNELFTTYRKADKLPDNYARQFQMEGPAWENDKIGFRYYNDERNGFDVFGKLTNKLVLDNVGLNDNYHELNDWGMDVLKVGRSLGAGALAFVDERDHVTRLSNAQTTSVSILYEGPIKSAFEIHHEGLTFSGQTFNLTQTIEIWASQNFYRSTITTQHLSKNIRLATGLSNLMQMPPKFVSNSENSTLIVYGEFGELNSTMGLGVKYTGSEDVKHISIQQTDKGIEHSELMVFELAPEQVLSFDVFADWSHQQPEVFTADEFQELIEGQVVFKQ